MKVFDAKTCCDTTALQPMNRIKTVYVNVFKCITLAVMSLLLGLPPPNSIHTHTNTASSSSLPGSTGQLSLLLVSADGVRGNWGGYEGRGLGVGGSTAEQMQKAPPGFAGDRLFPSHPAAVQLPRHQLS